MYLQSSCFICLKGFLGKVVLTGFLIEVWIRVNFDTGLLPVSKCVLLRREGQCLIPQCNAQTALTIDIFTGP